MTPEHRSGASRESAVGRLLRQTWRAGEAGWRDTAPDARRRFLARLVIALAVAVALSTAAALALEPLARDGRLPGDRPIAAWTQGLLSIHSALWLGAFTSSAMAVPIVLVAAVLAARASRWERAVEALGTLVASKAIIWAAWLTWSRERPADLAGGVLVPADMSSFPSGHTVQAWTIYGLLALWWARASGRAWERALAWGLVVILTAVIGVGRVRIGAHHSSDIVGGALLGGLWVAGVAWAERALPGARDAPAARPRSRARA